MLKMYNELADWWDLLSPPSDYADEAAFFYRVLRDTGLPAQPTLLELGCGGGNNALHLKTHFAQLTLSDVSPQMLTHSQHLNPECEHIVGDMRTLRLDRTFDVVFIHDAIGYMTTTDDLRLALETAFLHCKAGGVALFVPDHVKDTFVPDTDHGGSDGETRSIRYLEWTYASDGSDSTCTVEYVYVLREANQPTRIEHERHVNGLFPRATWLELLQDIGFQTDILRDEYRRDLFLACRD